MSRAREVIVLILCALGVGGLGFQAKEPTLCTGTSYIMWIVGGNQLNHNADTRHVAHIIVGVVCVIAIAALILLAVDLFGGKSKGLLKVSYFLFLIYHIIMIASCVVVFRVTDLGNKASDKLNISIFFVSELIMVIMLAVYLLRELGTIRVIPNLSAVLLVVVAGQLLANGVLIDAHSPVAVAKGLFYGLCASMPIIAMFVFEKFILEASIRRRRR